MPQDLIDRKITYGLCISLLFLILTSCSKTSESCDEGFPKKYGNPVVLEHRADIYSYSLRELNFVRSMEFEEEIDDRIITLNGDNTFDDSVWNTDAEYQFVDGCIMDERNWELITLNDNCTEMTITYLDVSVEQGTLSAMWECGMTEDEAIQDAIDRHLTYGRFDTVNVYRFVIGMSLLEN